AGGAAAAAASGPGLPAGGPVAPTGGGSAAWEGGGVGGITSAVEPSEGSISVSGSSAAPLSSVVSWPPVRLLQICRSDDAVAVMTLPISLLLMKKGPPLHALNRSKTKLPLNCLMLRTSKADEESALWMLGKAPDPYMKRYTDSILQARAQDKKKNPEGTIIVADFVAGKGLPGHDADVKRQRTWWQN
ncbi:hypothetical protein THAOC_37269, partial [Thalassiosira oceanica]